ncbi:hypothetical protein ACWDRR_36705 [Kitasatospora sp. NPDC003701]
MADIVLVHGMGPLGESAEDLRSAWTGALSATLRTHDAEDLADELADGTLTTSVAYYRSLFTPHVAAAEAGLIPDSQVEKLSTTAEDLLVNVEERGSDSADRNDATRELELFRAELGPAQGAGEVARLLLGALGRVRPLAAAGFNTLSANGISYFSQVAAYLDDADVREAAAQTLLTQIGPETRVVLAHSLGTVVAYEALHRLERPLPLLVTFGSPLGLRTVVKEKLRPHPLTMPPRISQWVNVADPDDFFVATLHLEKIVNDPYGLLAATRKVGNRGINHHDAVKYLGHGETVLPLVRALRGR